ncbi:MAG TPA: outer membrane beta-barrel protein [Devosia sp.]|jgi:outer membrane immunogenic protein
MRLTAILLASVALTASAAAADLYTAAPAALPVYEEPSNWTGFYAGIFGGVAFNPADPGTIEIDQDLDGNFDEPLVAPLLGAFGSNFFGSRDAGVTLGLEAGYDYQIDNFVVGGIIDLAYVDYRDVQSARSSTPANYDQISEVEWLGTIRARAGYLVTPDVLAYVHGGLAVGGTDFSFSSSNPNGVSRGGEETSVGFQIGAGVEAKVTSNISLGLEYAYTNLGDTDFTTRFNNAPFRAVNPAGSDLRGSDRSLDFHTVKASLKYRF